MQVICLKGLQGCGKDTFAELAKKSPYNVKRLSIADGIREIVWKKYSSKIKEKNYLYGDYSDKEKEIDPSWLVSTIAATHLKVPSTTPWTGRLLLQFEGTVAGTDIFEEVWTESLRIPVENALEDGVDFLIITDTRRPSQFQFFKRFKKCQATVIEIQRDGVKSLSFSLEKPSKKEADTHETEKLSASYPADMCIQNTSLQEYEKSIHDFLRGLAC